MADFIRDDNKRIGKNIYLLRKHRHESRKDLAKFLKVAYITMTSFENGTRTIHDEYIEKIAERYNVSFNMIKEQEITEEILVLYDTNVNLKDVTNIVEFFFHSKATSEEARKNEIFKMADEYYHQRIIRFDFMNTMLKVTRERYYQSYKESGLIAGAANTLMMLFFEFAQLDVSPIILEKMLNEKVTIGEIYLEGKRITQSLSGKRKKFIEDTTDIFNECMTALGSADEGRIFAEYYLALKYWLNMIDNGRSYRENLEIGRIMMLDFARIGNPIAKKATSIFDFE